MIEALQRQLTNAKAELAELQESFTIAHRAPPVNGTLEDVGKIPQGNGGSRWSEIHIESNVSNEYTSSSSSSSSSISSFNCNFWIGSYSSSSGSDQASNETRSMSQNLHVEINMRTTYVTADRSGWFDPSLLDMSKSFMRGTGAGSYTSWSEWKKKQDGSDQTPDEAAKAITEDTDFKPRGYLAAFPAGYILVKDCVIKITSSASDLSAFKKHFDQQSQSSGGFLCFSHSSASRSSNDSSASTSKQASDGIVVRIPGPQILGYIMQLVGKDDSQPFQATPDDQLFIEDMDAPNPGTGGTGGGPQHSVGPLPDLPKPGRQATVRRYDDDLAGDSGTGRQGSPATSQPGDSRPAAPAHGVQDPAAPKPAGHLIDALKIALNDSDVPKWLETQPSGTKDELWAKLTEMFGKAAKAT